MIELLVVIAIIGILAGLLLPALARAKRQAKVAKASTDLNSLAGAISGYQSDYTRFPAHYKGGNDYTFGTRGVANYNGPMVSMNDASIDTNNSVLMIILVDIDRPNDWNSNHAKNPQRHSYFSAKQAGNSTGPGLGDDYVLRDPWSNPYMVSLDLNYDNKTTDAFYGKMPGWVDVPSPILVWSLGPDGDASSAVATKQGPNKDNVVSWK